MFKEVFNLLIRKGDENASGPALDQALDRFDDKILQMEQYIQPAPESKPRTPFDSGLPRKQLSMANLTWEQKMRVIPQAVPLFLNMQRGSRIAHTPNQSRHQASPEIIEDLEALARKAGAKDIRYVKVPRTAIFQDKGIPHKYAIIFTVEMEKEPISTSPSFDSQVEVMRGYKNLSVIAGKLTSFLHERGFAAYPGTALGGTTDYVYLGELAGLGAVGYHGLLITPGEGARLRIGTVYTNIENLPIQEEN
ncbi:MAG: hypothetical protein KC496_18670 [Anaerolineae bacterium]|nr:hypothetical protein [Anaerolineae bacterium]